MSENPVRREIGLHFDLFDLFSFLYGVSPYWPQVTVNYICLVYYVLQLPVACKACPCGHNFFSARRAVITAQAAEVRDEGIMKRRRTERVKRGKPNYYDALEYEKQTKKVITLVNSCLVSGSMSSEFTAVAKPEFVLFIMIQNACCG